MNESWNKILDRVSDFFNILDLSYLVSGSFSFMILYIYLKLWNATFLIEIFTGLHWSIYLIIVYIMGLLMVTIGRTARQRWNRQRERFYSIYARYSNCIVEKSGYTESERIRLKKAYSNGWRQLRIDAIDRNGASYFLRIWTMVAVFEGLISAFLLLTVLHFCYVCTSESSCLQKISLAIPLGLMIFCWFEARHNAEMVIKHIAMTYKEGDKVDS